MKDFPHHYTVMASGDATGDVLLEGHELPTLHSRTAAGIWRSWRPLVARDVSGGGGG